MDDGPRQRVLVTRLRMPGGKRFRTDGYGVEAGLATLHFERFNGGGRPNAWPITARRVRNHVMQIYTLESKAEYPLSLIPNLSRQHGIDLQSTYVWQAGDLLVW